MLHPFAKEVLEDLDRKSRVQVTSQNDAQKLAQARAMTASLADYSGEPPTDVKTEDGAAGDVGVRFYHPPSKASELLIWYHGGGAMAGSLDSHDVALRQLCEMTRWSIASVDYRLAPEHPSPAPQDDCLAATRELMTLPYKQFALGGDSIGGMFAIITAMRLRDEGGPRPDAVVALYPNTDLTPTRDFPSLRQESGHVMTRESLEYEHGLFVPDPADRLDPIVSPLHAPDLTNLPPMRIVTCEHDPLRDEGEAMVARLRDAGNDVTHHRLPGMVHGLLQMRGWIDWPSALVDTMSLS